MKEATPMTPSAPGRFSTMTGCAHRADKRSAKILALKSVPLPAGTGRIRCTVRSGQANAEPHNEQHTAAAKTRLEIIGYIDLNPSWILASVYADPHLAECIFRSLSRFGT